MQARGRADRVVRPYGGLQEVRWGGPMWASAPTEALQGVQWAGDRKGRPYGSVTRSAGGERNPPVTASPCQPPLGKGAYKDGGYGLPRPVCALASQ